MSDYRVVAAATETLRNILLDALSDPLGGADVRTGPPQEYSPHEVSEGLINIFLYGVRPNATWRNEELVYRRPDGTLMRKPQLALDLLYLLTFYGDDQRNIPLLLLGRTVAALHATPYAPSRFMPGGAQGRESHANSSDDILDLDDLDDLRADHVIPLDGSGLASQAHALSFILQPLSHDDLSQLWTLFSQVSYTTSVAYVGTVVLIEPDVTPSPDLPVRRVDSQFPDAWPPKVEALRPQMLVWAPAARVEILGQGFESEHIQVQIDNLEAPILERSSERLLVSLPEGLAAGISSVQVVRSLRLRSQPEELRPALSSEPVPLVVRPVVRQAWQEPTRRSRPESESVGVASSEVEYAYAALETAPNLPAGTEVRVLLDPIPRDQGRGYVLSVLTPARPSPELRFSARLEPGEYLVRLQLPGSPHPVTSTLAVGPESPQGAAGRFDGPRLRIAQPFTEA